MTFDCFYGSQRRPSFCANRDKSCVSKKTHTQSCSELYIQLNCIFIPEICVRFAPSRGSQLYCNALQNTSLKMDSCHCHFCFFLFCYDIKKEMVLVTNSRRHSTFSIKNVTLSLANKLHFSWRIYFGPVKVNLQHRIICQV